MRPGPVRRGGCIVIVMQVHAPAPSSSVAKRLRLALLVWLSMLGVDLVLNAAVFAGIYKDGGPFLLAPIEAFHRIPIGYAAFLILAIGIVEIADRLQSSGVTGGVRLGVAMGGSLAAVWSLSLFSIATIRAEVALATALVWLALLLMGSVVAAIGRSRTSLRGLAVGVALFDVACLVIVVALQSFGVVPTQTA